jgi:hypothetical protein
MNFSSSLVVSQPVYGCRSSALTGKQPYFAAETLIVDFRRLFYLHVVAGSNFVVLVLIGQLVHVETGQVQISLGSRLILSLG